MGRLDAPGFTALDLVSGALSLPAEAVRGKLVEQVEVLALGEAWRDLSGTGQFQRSSGAGRKHRLSLEVTGVAAVPTATGEAGAPVVGEIVRVAPATPGMPTADYRVVSLGWRWLEAAGAADWRLVLEEV